MAISLGGHLILCAIPITTGRVNSGCRPTFFFEILWNRCHYREHLQVDIHFLCLRFGANILSSEIGGFETVKVSGGSALFERASLGAGHFFSFGHHPTAMTSRSITDPPAPPASLPRTPAICFNTVVLRGTIPVPQSSFPETPGT